MHTHAAGGGRREILMYRRDEEALAALAAELLPLSVAGAEVHQVARAVVVVQRNEDVPGRGGRGKGVSAGEEQQQAAAGRTGRPQSRRAPRSGPPPAASPLDAVNSRDYFRNSHTTRLGGRDQQSNHLHAHVNGVHLDTHSRSTGVSTAQGQAGTAH